MFALCLAYKTISVTKSIKEKYYPDAPNVVQNLILSSKIISITEIFAGGIFALMDSRVVLEQDRRRPCPRCSLVAIFNPVAVIDGDVEGLFHSNFEGHRGRCRQARL